VISNGFTSCSRCDLVWFLYQGLLICGMFSPSFSYPFLIIISRSPFTALLIGMSRSWLRDTRGPYILHKVASHPELWCAPGLLVSPFCNYHLLALVYCPLCKYQLLSCLLYVRRLFVQKISYVECYKQIRNLHIYTCMLLQTYICGYDSIFACA
jgi:hypothetical protein